MKRTFYKNGTPEHVEVKKESIGKPQLGMYVYHTSIYNGNERMKIVGIREKELELEGDYSGGTHNVTQKDWLPIEGAFCLRKVCDQVVRHGSCQLHNLHCGFPDCEPYI